MIRYQKGTKKERSKKRDDEFSLLTAAVIINSLSGRDAMKRRPEREKNSNGGGEGALHKARAGRRLGSDSVVTDMQS